MPETQIRPWWETMAEDPWYITGSKALFGEQETEGMRRGEIMPWVNTLSPLLFLGKGGRMGAGGLEFPRPRVPVLTPEELKMPPAVEKLFNAVKGYQPPKADVFYGDPFSPPMYVPHKVLDRPWEPFDYQGLPYAERPEAKVTITPEDLPFGQQQITITPDEIPTGQVIPALPKPPIDQPFSVEDVATIGELGLKVPPRSPSEVKQDWENFVAKFMSGSGQSGDMHQMPGGTHFGGQEKAYHGTQDYNYEFAPREEKPARFMSNAQPTPPPDFDFSQYY